MIAGCATCGTSSRPNEPIGLSVSFGLLDVPHVAHPAVMVLGSYCTFVLAAYGLDPIVAGIVLMPVFFLLVS